jgi:hypothetical protein
VIKANGTSLISNAIISQLLIKINYNVKEFFFDKTNTTSFKNNAIIRQLNNLTTTTKRPQQVI